MVMKYAVSEKSVIDLKREIQSRDTKMKDAIKERDSMQGKLKTVIAEKVKLNQLLDSKVSNLILCYTNVAYMVHCLSNNSSRLADMLKYSVFFFFFRMAKYRLYKENLKKVKMRFIQETQN